MNRAFAMLIRAPQSILIVAVKAYRLLISPSLGANCRFMPSCSAYSLEALNQYGAATGTYLTLRRLARCNPWCEGGHDPVPVPAPVESSPSASLFSRLLRLSDSISSEKTPS